ncbi:hypothetical protein RhiirC2_856438 [Rhizophagus irregularis]|uniref:Protein kinase domain-containing protein n=1 Tax=Rhizophagus irregularis TaxID=588596 RepID=A0A2N1MHK9_9GLOM|nr:hypothetical protein RhiirC2_856438 [Rhizophagus irregularis]
MVTVPEALTRQTIVNDLDIIPNVEDVTPEICSTPLVDKGFTWHGTLGILIPDELLPYVDKPVYTSKRQERINGLTHPPGSAPWRHAIELRRESAERAWAFNKRYDERSIKAKLWGTSVNRIDYREGLVDDLTGFQNHYHEKITKVASKRQAKLSSNYRDYMDQLTYEPNYRYKGDTSDDTRLLELRPRKRPTNTVTTLDRSSDSVKKLRLDLKLLTDDILTIDVFILDIILQLKTIKIVLSIPPMTVFTGGECLATLYCEYCVQNYLKENFSNWTSGNDDIDNLIQECQIEALGPENIVEWIPYSNLKKIKYLTKGGFSEIYTAGWINGMYSKWDSEKKQLTRHGYHDIVLKKLENVESANQSWFEEHVVI